jgi:hypothetical protein
MLEFQQSALIEVLQTAISPVVLVSGIGLLILSMTNRFAHTTDRIRILLKSLHEDAEFDEQNYHRRAVQIRILYRRSRILLLAISLALGSILFVSLLVTALFTTFFVNIDLQGTVIMLFTVSLLCLVASIVLFIQDMSLALKALTEELRGQM